MNFILNDYHRNIPEKELLEDVLSVSEKLKKNTVTIEEYNNYGKYHACTLTRRFGSWFNVLSEAKLKPSRSKLNISDEELFNNLYKVWISLTRQPKYTEMKKPLSLYSAGTYEKRFGSWRNALEEFIKYTNNDQVEEHLEEKAITVHNNEEKPYKHKTKRDISERLRFRILMRDGFTCKKCGRSPIKDPTVTLHVDHIIPWSMNGETIPENLETKCDKCNLGKGNAFNI